jgi:hypothetical protein
MAINFTGTATNNVDLRDNRNYFRNIGGGTIMAWITYGVTGTARSIIDISTTTASTSRAQLSSTSGNLIRIQGRALDGDASSTISGVTALTAGQRVHVAGVWNFTQRVGRIYLDGGNLENTAGIFTNMTAGNTSNTASATAAVGSDAAGTAQAWVGNIEDVRIYNRALGPNEILEIFTRRGNDNIVDGLFARWLLGDLGAGQAVGNLADLSDNQLAVGAAGSLTFVEGTLRTRKPVHPIGR